jgi:hypothetical protein
VLAMRWNVLGNELMHTPFVCAFAVTSHIVYLYILHGVGCTYTSAQVHRALSCLREGLPHDPNHILDKMASRNLGSSSTDNRRTLSR